jgi:hypothetical protein
MSQGGLPKRYSMRASKGGAHLRPGPPCLPWPAHAPDLLNKKSEEPGMTSLNKPVSTIYLAVASAFVLAPPAQAET